MASNQNTAARPAGLAGATIPAEGGRAVRRPGSTVRSMTGYAHRSADTPTGRATVELRSVNSRFADLQFRLSDDVRAIEPLLREQISAAVSRGKIDCRVQLRGRETGSAGVHLDEALIESLARADARVRALAPQAAPMTVADYLRWQAAAEAGGGSSDDVHPAEAIWPSLQPVVAEVLADFIASREREGARGTGRGSHAAGGGGNSG
jgi:uncharacterized protein (TIGR00255 family)